MTWDVGRPEQQPEKEESREHRKEKPFQVAATLGRRLESDVS
jgi:hypothetical protein